MRDEEQRALRAKRLEDHKKSAQTKASLRTTLHSGLTAACQAAGVIEAPLFARNLLEASVATKNQSQLSYKDKREWWALPSSTFSARIAKANLRQFLDYVNGFSANQTVSLLNKYRADPGSLVAIMDPHQEPYQMEKAQTRRMRRGRLKRVHDVHCERRDCRCQSAVASHSDNKPGLWANDWLVIVLTWTHQGHRFIGLLYLQPLLGLDRMPNTHAKILVRILRRHHIRPTLAVVDQGYDDKNFRATLNQAGLRFAMRVRLNRGATNGVMHSRYFVVKGSTSPINLNDIVNRLENDRSIPLDQPTVDPRTNEVHVTRSWLATGHLPGDPQEYQVWIRVGLQRDPKRSGRWQRIPRHSIGLLFPSVMALEIARRLYAARWRIETAFHLWALDRPKPRSKTITSHAFNFTAFVMRMTLAIEHQVLVLLFWTQFPDMRLSGPAGYTIIDACTDALVHGTIAGFG